MGSLNTRIDEVPKAQSNNTFIVTHRTTEQMEKIVRENWKYMDEMMDSMEPGHNYGAFPFGYPCNTTR